MSADRRNDPTWYRIRYTQAVQALLLADGRDLEIRPDALGRAATAYLDRLPVAIDDGLAVRNPFHIARDRAERDARALLLDTALRLRRARLRHPGQRKRKSESPRGQLLRFLDATVEPAVVVLLWSARVEQGAALRLPMPGGPPDRRADDLLSDAWLADYLSYLLDGTPYGPPLPEPRRRGPLRLRRPVPLAPPNARVSYNLACLMARQARRTEDPESLGASARWLARSLRSAAPPRRTTLAFWAWRDPGLAGFREADPAWFAAVAGPRPRPGGEDDRRRSR